MPNWYITMCFFAGHRQTAINLRGCSRCGITEKYLREMASHWRSYLCMGPKCFLWNVWRVVRVTVRRFVCNNIGHRVKESWRYYGKLDLKEASLVALGENEEARLVGAGFDVKKRRDQLMDDGLFKYVIFCERCGVSFSKKGEEGEA